MLHALFHELKPIAKHLVHDPEIRNFVSESLGNEHVREAAFNAMTGKKTNPEIMSRAFEHVATLSKNRKYSNSNTQNAMNKFHEMHSLTQNMYQQNNEGHEEEHT